MTRTLVFLSLLLALPLLAQPTITSVSPSSGPVTGGTTVVIRGSGFDTTCPPAPLPCGRTAVFFGSIEAASFRVIDASTIEAVTSPQFPGVVSVGVALPKDAASLKSAFTYTGEIADAFEPLLLPLYVPGTAGAFGSFFLTELTVWGTTATPVPVYGLGNPCAQGGIDLCLDPPVFVTTLRRDIPPAPGFRTFGDPGLLPWIPKRESELMAATLRVRDLSRASQDWGTALPLVRERDFRAGPIALLNVPMTSGFRDTLRIYSLDRDVSVHVRLLRFDGSWARELDLDLRNGGDMFHPAYAQAGDFPVEPYSILFDIQPNTAGKRIWAFVSITHNETQHVTIVTPH